MKLIKFADWYLLGIKITRKWSIFVIWVLICFYDQDSNQIYKKVIKILDLGIDLYFGSRLQECDMDSGFGYCFILRIKIVIKITWKWSNFGIWVLVSIEDQDYMKVVKIWDYRFDFFLGSRLKNKVIKI